MENGVREVFFGSNPHSNGDGFSRLKESFLDRIDDTKISIILIKVAKINLDSNILIT